MTRSKVAILAGIIILSIIAGIMFSRPTKPTLPAFSTAFIQPKNIALPHFALGENKQYTNALFQDKWSLVFFGYASCPDVCPTELYNLNNVAKIVDQAGKPMPQVIFISVDSQRDTDNMLASYAQFYNTDFIGITGETSEIDKLVATFGVIYQKIFLATNGQYVSVPYTSPLPPEQADSYLINHSSRIYLVNPQGEYVATFAPPHKADDIAADLIML
jgi:protein SCO1/2